ncbi:MAG: YihY/virulence factor BrkB family protein [Bdellovibrionales bacterium]|nr:YihY/virulence factor BrkB family protein [Bdellovibrionales bacterium]
MTKSFARIHVPEPVAHVFRTLRKCLGAWSDDQATTQSGALAYYTLFSIAPLLLIAVSVAGIFFGHEGIHGRMLAAIQDLFGPEGANTIERMLEATTIEGGNPLKVGIGVAVLLIGATTVFGQLQDSLNIIWKVRPKAGGWRTLLRQRMVSFSMILVIGAILLASVLTSTWLTTLGTAAIWQRVGDLVTFGLVTVLFGALYKILPDVKLAWKDVRFGACLSAVLFMGGKLAIGWYLRNSAIASTSGAAGATVIILVWAYYSAAILLFGAEYTRHHAIGRGRHPRPKPGAESILPTSENLTGKTLPQPIRFRRPDESTRLKSPSGPA